MQSEGYCSCVCVLINMSLLECLFVLKAMPRTQWLLHCRDTPLHALYGYPCSQLFLLKLHMHVVYMPRVCTYYACVPVLVHVHIHVHVGAVQNVLCCQMLSLVLYEYLVNVSSFMCVYRP